MKIGCIVMAAGNARRFGSNKLDARVEGKTLLRRALEAVPASCFARVAVVTQYPQGMELAREMGFLPVENSRPDLGLSHTIALGMAHMQDMDAVLFQVSDQPLLRRESAPLRETVARAPLERLLVETDSPYVLPDIPWEGSRKSLGRVRNSSLLLPRIIEEIARLKRLPPETVEAAVLENTRRVFRLPDMKNGG